MVIRVRRSSVLLAADRCEMRARRGCVRGATVALLVDVDPVLAGREAFGIDHDLNLVALLGERRRSGDLGAAFRPQSRDGDGIAPRARSDGGHKHDRFLTDVLGRYVEWVPVCPELETGMGVPREPVRLIGEVAAPRMVGTRSGIDHTAAMRRYAATRVRALEALELSGYVL